MNCPKCNQPIENGAAFCGNCGQSLQATPAQPAPAAAAPPTRVQPISPIAQVYDNQPPTTTLAPSLGAPIASAGNAGVPAYAIGTHTQHKGEMKALISVICGVLGVVGALLMPLMALVFGITGLVLGTTTRHSSHRLMSTIGIVISSLAILGGLAGWAYNIAHNPALQTKTSHKTPTTTTASASVTTPCYDLGFVTKLQIKNDADSCDVQAYDGLTFDRSSDIYKVYANQVPSLTEAGFEPVAKEALEKDIKTTLPEYSITSQGAAEFAGSTAYYVTARNASKGVTVIEGAVLHKTEAGYNLFVLLHAGMGSDITLDELETQWQWK